MRLSALVGATLEGWRAVSRFGPHAALETLRDDRSANREAFAGEQVVRLPRRISRARNLADLEHRIRFGRLRAG